MQVKTMNTTERQSLIRPFEIALELLPGNYKVEVSSSVSRATLLMIKKYYPKYREWVLKASFTFNETYNSYTLYEEYDLYNPCFTVHSLYEAAHKTSSWLFERELERAFAAENDD